MRKNSWIVRVARPSPAEFCCGIGSLEASTTWTTRWYLVVAVVWWLAVAAVVGGID